MNQDLMGSLIRPMFPHGPLTQGQQSLYDIIRSMQFGYTSPQMNLGVGANSGMMPFGPQMGMGMFPPLFRQRSRTPFTVGGQIGG